LDRYAIIKDELIANTIVASADFIADNFPDAIICPDEFGVGDKYVDGAFVKVIVLLNDETL